MGYRKLATGPVLLWALTAVLARLPIAVAPLGFVFLVRESSGGYSLGATLAGAYVVGEVVGALVVGTRRAGGSRGAMAVGLLVGAVAFGAVVAAAALPPVVLIGLAFVAGAAPAASPGGMRTMLTRLVGDDTAATALSAESVLTQVIWAAAPALVVTLALSAGAGTPVVLAAVCAGGASALLMLLPAVGAPAPAEAEAVGKQQETGRYRVLASAWPIYLTSAATMALVSTAELALTPLLEYRSIAPGWSGVLLTGFSVATAVGAILYGLREWPGRVRVQSIVLLLVMSVCVALAALVPWLPGIAVLLALTGLLQAGVMVTRSLSLREALPAHAHTAGYSVQYAVQGIGYSVTAVVTALVLAHSTPVVAVAGGAVLTVLLTVASGLTEVRAPTRAGAPA